MTVWARSATARHSGLSRQDASRSFELELEAVTDMAADNAMANGDCRQYDKESMPCACFRDFSVFNRGIDGIKQP
jgi:hypothetical protein